jgi:multimeric flavodoxin WrbA
MFRQKKVMAICGSPRAGKAGGKSLTERVLKTFLEGLSPKRYRIFYPHLMKIAYCTGCYTCWFKTPGVCAIRDDMAEIVAEWQDADLIILASPVYVEGFSAQLKTVLDRSICLFEPLVSLDGRGHCRHELRSRKDRAALLISTCGFSELDNFDAIRTHFAAVCRNYFWKNAGEILIPASAAASLPRLYDEKFAAVKKAGEELAREGRITFRTAQKISEEGSEAGCYQDIINPFFRKLMG